MNVSISCGRTRLLLGAVFLLITAQRLPAPIQKVPQSPTPAPEQPTKKATPRSKAARSEPKTKLAPKASATPAPALPFAGTWVGINGALRGRTVVVNPSQTIVTIEGGPWGRETGSVEGNTGSQLVWTTTPVSVHVKWTLTLLQGGKSAQVITKHFLGSESGAFEKKQ
jgi:hypothetical protein